MAVRRSTGARKRLGEDSVYSRSSLGDELERAVQAVCCAHASSRAEDALALSAPDRALKYELARVEPRRRVCRRAASVSEHSRCGRRER